MEIVTTTVTVCKFSELTEAAQTRAVELIRQRLSDGWDGADSIDIRDVMIATLAEKIGTPGVMDYGVADFPGIDGVTIDGWDLERHQSLAVSGILTRKNAPALPWTSDVDHVQLTGSRSDFTSVYIEGAELPCSCPGEHEQGCLAGLRQVDGVHLTTMDQAVRDALSAAWSAGEKEGDYKTGEEYARQVAEDHRFTEDGEIFS